MITFSNRMNKTPLFYIEKYLGLIFGIGASYNCYIHFSCWLFTVEKDFTDREITVCASLFGFLLTILTLLIQGQSETISEMKKHGSFKRLIHFNKTVILISAITTLIALFSIFIKDYLETYIRALIGSINLGFFIWTLTNTLIFVMIFFKIITTQIDKE